MRFQEHHLFQILKGFENQHLPLDLFLSHYFRSHTAIGASDRRFISETVYGITRWKGLLDHIAGKENAPDLRYSLYRGFQPSEYFFVNSIPLHIRLSFPKELFSLFVDQYGEKKAIEICQVNNEQAPITVRFNPLKTTREALLARWKGKFDVEPTLHSPLGINFKKRIPFFELPEFKEGLFEVQDEGSQLVALQVKAEEGDQVFDYCSGSGGKSLAIAHLLQNKGQIYLHDIRPLALTQARKRLQRAGIQIAQFLPPNHIQLKRIKQNIDWVLVDAPCSGTGTLRRNPDMKWKFEPQMVKRLSGEQREIFEKALSYVKPGGFIVYATCSILRDENEAQVEHFLKTYPLELQTSFSSLPTSGGMDGFFAATFKKVPSSSSSFLSHKTPVENNS